MGLQKHSSKTFLSRIISFFGLAGHSANDYIEDEQGEYEIAYPRIPRTSELRIAALDDNLPILKMLDTILTRDGHTVFPHTTGSSLLEVLFPQESKDQPLPYDLILLDLLLSGEQKGDEVFFAIRKRFSAQELPIIIITAVDKGTLIQFRQILPDDVPLLRKPFRPHQLRQLIAQLTGQNAER